MDKKSIITTEITDSDDFLDLSTDAQALYFHLCAHSSEGRLNNARAIKRAVGATDDALKLLFDKGFIEYDDTETWVTIN